MRETLAFDVYGTLIDTNGVIITLQNMVGDQAAEFSRTWRDKQLEYSFRRGLMRQYRDFAVCTREALDYTCRLMRLDLSTADRQMLINAYRVLPVFGDVPEVLKALSKDHFHLVAFSNGKADAVRDLLEHAGILSWFDDIVSVDDVHSFKPDPAVYHHLLQRCQSEPGQTWLISSNPFDILGGCAAGLRTAWLRRSPSVVFDTWAEMQPDTTIPLLTGLHAAIREND